MTKNIKMLAVLSAAAVMTVAIPQMGLNGSIGTVYAKDKGWTETEGVWRYYEEEDYYVTDTWKKRGDDWYYLNEDGLIATNAQIDGYYVNQDGKRVMNQWVSIQNEEEWDSDLPDAYWYYYGKNGQITMSKWAKIDGQWHYFDEEGRMLTGKVEIEGDTYYLGNSNDGAMKYGWIQLENYTDDPDVTHSWYYFEKDGKMVKNAIDKKIDGDYFTFEDGVMQTGWYKLPSASADDGATPSDATANTSSNDSVAGFQYYDPDSGKRVSGWQTIEGAPDISEEGEQYTFYFKNGKPYFAESGIQVFTVDSKKYAFNTKGEMQTGLKVVTLEDGGSANYYFDEAGVMKTGKQIIYNEDLGENQTWFFYTDGTRKGQGFHGIRDNSVFEYGLRKEADADLKVSPVTLDDKQYLVNASGAIQKASSSSKSSTKPELGNGFKDVKDANGKVWVVDTNGIVQ